MKEITDWLISQQDEKYRDFQAKLIPTVPKNIEGHRMPAWVHNKSIQKSIESRRVPQEDLDSCKVIHIL